VATLDIVIPAHKGRYLEALLQSLSAQTSREFGVIVCDDASPDPIAEICEPFRKDLNLRYIRFDANLGRSDLAAQWNRSIKQSSAEWIMLPGDDDLIDPTCVAAFHEALRAHPDSTDVFSFPVRTIDRVGKIIRETEPIHVRNAEEYFTHYIGGTICPMPVGFIFSRRIFDAFHGFVSFDSGMYSDAATIGLFCSQRGIRAIEGAHTYWRQSEMNISPQMSREPARWARLNMDFILWLSSNSDRLKISREGTRKLIESDSWNVYGLMRELPFSIWLRTVLRYSPLLSARGTRSTLWQIYRFARERWNPRSKSARNSGASSP
jgi:glycosyltransferase involved in cell wall biosynthesis